MKKLKWTPFLIIFGLLLFGLLMVYDASSAIATREFNDKYHFIKDQVKWLIIGVGTGILASFFDYRQLKKLALPLLVITLGLLLAVFLPGIGIKVGQGSFEAHRWINLGVFILQPSEFAKLSIIIYLSAWLTNKEKGQLVPFLLLIGLLVGLIILEPDMGTAVVLLGTTTAIYFLSGSQLLGLLAIAPVVLIGGVLLSIKSSYRLQRVLTFLNPDADPLGAGYQIRQALIALGSGGLFGLGLGNSRQKYYYLPEATTDSIFAIIGEELGLFGTISITALFMFFFFQAIKLTLNVENNFGRLLGMGIICWLAFQTIVHLGSIVGLIPLTGVPLPFISYGGSALITELAGVGILANIWKQNT